MQTDLENMQHCSVFCFGFCPSILSHLNASTMRLAAHVGSYEVQATVREIYFTNFVNQTHFQHPSRRARAKIFKNQQQKFTCTHEPIPNHAMFSSHYCKDLFRVKLWIALLVYYPTGLRTLLRSLAKCRECS